MGDYCVTRPDEYYMERIKEADLSDKTRRGYDFALKRIKECIRKPICEIITSPTESFKALEKAIPNRASLQTTVASLLAVMKHGGIKATRSDVMEGWYEHFKPLSDEVKKQRESNVPTERQEAGRVEWKTVTKALERLGRKDYGSREHVLLSMYTILAPRRQEDYYQVYLYQSKEDKTPKEGHHAYVDMTIERPVIHVKDYKTADTYKGWTKEIPDKLLMIIRKSLVREPRSYLITRINGDKYTKANSFTKFNNNLLKELFGPDVSLNSLRHAYADKIRDEKLSVWDHKQVALDMGHSQVQNMTYAFNTPMKKKGKPVV